MEISSYNNDVIKTEDLELEDKMVLVEKGMVYTEESYTNNKFKEKKLKIEKELELYRKDKESIINDELSSIRETGIESLKEEVREEIKAELNTDHREKLKADYDREMQAVQSKYREANDYLIKVKRAVKEKRDYWIEDNKEDLVEVIMRTAEKVIGKSIVLDSESVGRILKESVGEVKDHSSNIWVRVSEEAKEKLDQSGFNEERLEIISDPQLSGLNMLIESDNEWIESTTEGRLKEVRKIITDWIEHYDSHR